MFPSPRRARVHLLVLGIALWLAIGAVVTTAVALGVQLIPVTQGPVGGMSGAEARAYFADAYRAHPEWRRDELWGGKTSTWSYTRVHFDDGPQTPWLLNNGALFAYGAPFRCLQGGYWDSLGGGGPLQRTFWGAYSIEPFNVNAMWYFVHPLWPGFALNTLFYAVITWGLWQIPLFIRRRHRVKRNRCTRCGYDRAGIAAGGVCPECGMAVALGSCRGST